MNKIVPFIAMLLAGCAAPKYTYYFDHYTAKPSLSHPLANSGSAPGDSPLRMDGDHMTARSSDILMTPFQASETYEVSESRRDDASTIRRDEEDPNAEKLNLGIAGFSGGIENNQDSRIQNEQRPLIERKQLKHAMKQIRKDLRTKVSASRSSHPLNDQATQKLDDEVIVAIAFGAVGITLSLLGGISAAFWIAGVVLLGIGVYFFFDWLSKR